MSRQYTKEVHEIVLGQQNHHYAYSEMMHAQFQILKGLSRRSNNFGEHFGQQSVILQVCTTSVPVQRANANEQWKYRKAMNGPYGLHPWQELQNDQSY